MLDAEEGSLLILAHDDFTEAMQPLVDWRRTIGRRTEMVPITDVGNSVNDITDFIEEYLNDNPDFSYLLFVGDGQLIPPMTDNDGFAIDNAFGFLIGEDSFNDVFVGRFSAETVDQVETQVERTIEYERDINENDTWLNVGMGIARNEGAGGGHHGEADHEHMDFIRDTLLNYTFDIIHRNYDGNVPGMPNTTAEDISQNINNGLSIINYCNHGLPHRWSVAQYDIADVNNLTNTEQLPFIWSVACLVGDFTNNFETIDPLYTNPFDNCLSEAFLWANHNGQPSGAVAMYGSSNNQPWVPPMCAQDEMNSILTEESIFHGSTTKRTFGGIAINGSMFMITQYGAGGIATHETWILFGDPSLMVRTDVPTSFNPSYASSIDIGDDNFQVNVPNAEGSLVALTLYDDDNEEVNILGTSVITNGVAVIQFEEPISETGELTLAITGFNKVTYINSINITQTHDQSVEIAICLDRSGSMDWYGYMEDAKNASKTFVDMMQFGDYLAVTSFATSASVDYPFAQLNTEQDKTNAKNAIDNISASGMTAMGAGLQISQQELNKGNTDKKQAMIFLGDGFENRPPYVAEVLPTIPFNTDIYTIALGPESDQELLNNMAVQTGGIYSYSPGTDRLNLIYNSIRAKVTGQELYANFSETLDPGQYQSHNVFVDGSTTFVIFSLTWTGDELNFELTDPAGVVIDHTTDPNISFTDGPTYKTFSIINPVHGEYEVAISNPSKVDRSTSYNLTVSGESTLSMNVAFNKSAYGINEPILITAEIVD